MRHKRRDPAVGTGCAIGSAAICKEWRRICTTTSPMFASISKLHARLRSPASIKSSSLVAVLALGFASSIACGPPEDEDETEADRFGVGAACSVDADCEYEDEAETGGPVLECLPQFTGGYCGVIDCTSNDDCPEASACVAHEDGNNYCFRICVDKAECNAHRPADAQSNCSSNIEFVEPTSAKACVPPSSGG